MNLMYSKPRWNHVMMELANRAVNLVKFVCSALHLMIALVVIYQIRSVDCGTFPSSLRAKSYNTSEGRLCYMCAPGQFWKGDCIAPGEVAICQPCDIGFFQTVENVALTCQSCTKLCTQQNQELIEVCNSTTDNICQCSSGYFKLNDEGFCNKHKICAPGMWVKSPGNKDNDTICESCIEGKTFSVNESATEGCLPCTRCDVKGLYEMTPCTIKSDAQCVTSRPPDGSHIGAIVGSTLGSLILVIIILAVVRHMWLKRHRQNSQSPEDDPMRQTFINQPGSATSNGINSDPHPDEPMDQVIYSKDDETEHMKSNEDLPDSNKSNSSASIHKGIRLSVLTKLSTDLISANWKFFFRELSVEESRIQQVENDHCQNVKEQIYQLLLHLNQKGTLAKSNIIKALEAVHRNDLAAKYSEEEFSDS